MGSIAAKLVVFNCLLLSCLLAASSAAAAPAIDGTFPLSSELGANNKIVAGPDGNVWVTVESATKDVARITSGGQVEEFDIEGIETAVGIAPGPDGNMWVTDVETAARFSPGDPEGTDKPFTVPGIGAEGQIVMGPDGQMWVASNNSVVHFQPGDPTNTVQPITVNNLAPKDIDVAGSLIVIAEGGVENRIVTLTTAGVQKDFAIGGASQGVAGSSSGQIAFSAPGATPEEAGLISPPNPAQSFELLGDPFGVAFGGDGAYWIVQFAFGQLARVTTEGQLTFPITGLPLESARQIAVGPGGTLWVTLTKNEAKGVEPAVVRISGVEPPAPPPSGGSGTPSGAPVQISVPISSPETTLGRGKKLLKTKGKKAKVKLRFSSPSAGATFECALRQKRNGKLTPIEYKGCKSPRSYRLVPGKYVFLVRAVKDGVADGTPATRSFKVIHIH
jgi:streptogramin lyase